jgi:hypothetical protein
MGFSEHSQNLELQVYLQRLGQIENTDNNL